MLLTLHEVVLEWAKVCDSASYDVWYRIDFCLQSDTRSKFKEGGNCTSPIALLQH